MTSATCRLLATALLLAACTAPGPKQAPVDTASRANAAQSALPALELSPELLYKIMMAEIALQRGSPQAAVQAMLEIARETHDPRVAQRATEMAWNARLQKE